MILLGPSSNSSTNYFSLRSIWNQSPWDTCDGDRSASVSNSDFKLEKKIHKGDFHRIKRALLEIDWTFPVMFQQREPCWNVNYGQLTEMIAICLFRLNYVFLGWDNTSKLLQTLSESPRWQPGFSIQTFEVKEEKSCFCFSTYWNCCENLPRLSSHFSAPLYFTCIPVGKPLALLSFQHRVSTSWFPQYIHMFHHRYFLIY